jgi:hypothetical protein
LAVIGLFIIAAGTILATQKNIRNVVFLKNYRNFSYSNSGINFNLNYYKNSTVQKNIFIPNSTQNVIISPTLPDNGLPIETEINSDINSAPISSGGSSCNTTSTSVAFNVFIPAANNNVNICQINQDGVNSVYVGQFSNNGRHYAVIVDQTYDKQKASTDKTYARQVFDKLGLDPYKNDLKKFIGSINFSN